LLGQRRRRRRPRRRFDGGAARLRPPERGALRSAARAGTPLNWNAADWLRRGTHHYCWNNGPTTVSIPTPSNSRTKLVLQKEKKNNPLSYKKDDSTESEIG